MSEIVKRSLARIHRGYAKQIDEDKKTGRPRGEAFTGLPSGLGWNRRTSPEEIVEQAPRLFRASGLVPEDMDRIKQAMLEKEVEEKVHRKQLQREFAAKQAAEMLPESYIPRMWNIRFAYPKKLAEIETRHTLKDLEHVRNLALAGQLSRHINHPDNMAAFLTWLNATIDKKKG